MSNQSKNEKLKIRPYARLLTMLGEELIKSERIAIVELVKNSYDAFASWATVSFNNFGENLSYTNNSQIIIEDDGEGMTEYIIKNGMRYVKPYIFRHETNCKQVLICYWIY